MSQADRFWKPSRRIFLRHAVLATGALLAGAGREASGALQEGSPESEDEAVFRKVMTGAARKRLQQQSIGAAVAAMGRAFLGVPYVAHTLEEEGEEHLVVNLRGMDCTTFMENALVLGRCIRMNRTTFEAYREELTLVRYRGGVINGYPCRLHYFTDWVHDNARKNVLRDVTAELGGERADRRVEFMSTHPEKYRQLSRPANLEAIRTMEDAINARGFSVVPARRIKEILPRLQEGDIIGTATAIPGMDVSHVGLVIREDERPRFLHASLSGGAVWVADGTVADYVTAHPQMTGIVIARPLEPDPNR